MNIDNSQAVKIIAHLYGLLDDIDSVDDAAKDNDKLYREMVQSYQRKKNDSGVYSDGYTLFVKPELQAFCVEDVDDFDERWVVLVAAENAGQAKAIAADLYVGDKDRWGEFHARRVHVEVSGWPRVIDDLELLRQAGFREPGESFCEECQLAPMGLKHHEIVDDLCVDCC